MTKIILIRHGQTDFNLLELYQGGATDNPLNATGIQQAKDNAHFLKNTTIDLLVSSPMLRAKQTAQEILKYQNISESNILFEDNFKERFLGEAEGQPVAQWYQDFYAGNVSGLESFEHLTQRVIPSLLQLLHTHPEQTIAIVCHAYVIKVILHYIDPINYPYDFKITNASANFLTYDQQQFTIERVNQTIDSHN